MHNTSSVLFRGGLENLAETLENLITTQCTETIIIFEENLLETHYNDYTEIKCTVPLLCYFGNHIFYNETSATKMQYMTWRWYGIEKFLLTQIILIIRNHSSSSCTSLDSSWMCRASDSEEREGGRERRERKETGRKEGERRERGGGRREGRGREDRGRIERREEGRGGRGERVKWTKGRDISLYT